MLYFSRWKALATLLTALFICALAAPNFLPEKTLRSLPKWAQRHIVLGLDLQGGSHILLEVDINDVRKQKAETLRDDVRNSLRNARVGYTGLTIRDLSVEVRIREESDFQAALTKLRELSQPLGGLLSTTGQRSVEVIDAGNRVIRLTITQPGITERVRQVVDQAIQIVERRINEIGTVEPLIQRQGADRILVQVPGVDNPTRILDLLGRTAKLTFRLVDASVSPEQALQGRVPPESELLYGPQKDGKPPYVIERRIMVTGEELTDAQPGFDQRTSEPIVTFKFNINGARRFAQVTQENVGRPFAIVLDNEVISAPVIREPILGGSGQISGNFTIEQANDLAVLLRAGALPAKLTPIEQRVVGAGLGTGLDRQRNARRLSRRRPCRAVDVPDLRQVRPGGERRGRDQRRDDLRRAVAAQRDADASGHHRRRAHHRHRGQFQRADLRAHPRGGAVRPHRDSGDRCRVHARARDNSRLQHHDLHRSRGAVLHRHGAGPRLCGHAWHRHHHHRIHGLHAHAADRVLVGTLGAADAPCHFLTG